MTIDPRGITLVFDPKKKLGRIDAMNSLAEVVRIMHIDQNVNELNIQINKGRKILHTFTIKLV
jgi:hypothetical protein